jgi:hypothetical protein
VPELLGSHGAAAGSAGDQQTKPVTRLPRLVQRAEISPRRSSITPTFIGGRRPA